MKKISALILLFFPAIIFGQIPSKQGLKEYSIVDKGDTIHFYIYNPDNTLKTKVFLYLQGSGDLPMVNGDDAEPCCYNNYPKKLMMSFPKDYAFVYIQKVGLPYYFANLNSYSPGNKFIERNNVLDRAFVADKVVNYIVKKIYPNVKIVAVLGHSEGSDVAAKLAVLNKRVSHLCFASGNGASQAYNDILFLRKQMHKGEISALEAQNKLDSLFAGVDNVYKDPTSTKKYFNGDTYKWNYAINQPPIDNLLKLKIPIYLAIGSNDNKVPIETSDYIKSEFIRHQKTNLTYKVYLNYNHNFVEALENGEKVDHFKDLFMDFLNFIDKNSR